MSLPPNASITDVINKLSELEGINQKTELSSVIGAPAASTDTVAQQIVILQDIKNDLARIITDKGINTEPNDSLETIKNNVENIGGGSVTGVVVSSSTASSFTTYSGGSANRFYVEVSGLNFRPSHIVIAPSVFGSSNYGTSYYSQLSSRLEYINVSILSTTENTGDTRGYLNNSASAYVNETGFRLPVGSSGQSYIYYAYQ